MKGYQFKHRDPASICPFPYYDEPRTWAEFVDEVCRHWIHPFYVELLEYFADTSFRGVWITYNLGDGPSWEFHLREDAGLAFQMSEPDRDFWIAFRRAHDIPDMRDIEEDWDTWVCGRPFDVMADLFWIVKADEEAAELEAATRPAAGSKSTKGRL